MQADAGPIEFSDVVFKSAEEERRAPSMNNVSETMAPAIDAFTSIYCPACSAVSAMTNSVKLPNVALSNPPTMSPVLAATDSVA